MVKPLVLKSADSWAVSFDSKWFKGAQGYCLMGNKLCASSALAPSSQNTSTFQHELRLREESGYQIIAGVDEAGRGPLAGPVVAGCVVLPPSCEYYRFQDSKKVSAKKRNELYEYLHSIDSISFGVGIVSAEEIDSINILQASLLAMKRAVLDMVKTYSLDFPGFILVDGKFTIPMDIPQLAIIKGESKSASIAAASIVAKVTRDKLMHEYHQRYPLYNFKKNKGYPTKEHRLSIATHGPCPIHRNTFKGVKEHLKNGPENCPEKQTVLW